MSDTEERLRERLAQDLRAAMKGRHAARVAALRSILAALDNETAIPIEGRTGPYPVRSAEVPRRVLTDADVRAVLLRESAARRDAAFTYEMHGCLEEAALVRAEAEIIESYQDNAEAPSTGGEA